MMKLTRASARTGIVYSYTVIGKDEEKAVQDLQEEWEHTSALFAVKYGSKPTPAALLDIDAGFKAIPEHIEQSWPVIVTVRKHKIPSDPLPGK